jgi:hypothetical protein
MSKLTDPTEQSPRELHTARALNTLALAGAGHAVGLSAQKTYSHLNPAAQAKVARAVPQVVRRTIGSVSSRIPRTPTAGKAAIAVGTAWTAGHLLEGAGDLMGRRSINANIRRASEGEQGIAKAYVSPQARGTGVGKRLDARDRSDLAVSAGLAGAGGAAVQGSKLVGQAALRQPTAARTLKLAQRSTDLKHYGKWALGGGIGLGAVTGLDMANQKRKGRLVKVDNTVGKANEVFPNPPTRGETAAIVAGGGLTSAGVTGLYAGHDSLRMGRTDGRKAMGLDFGDPERGRILHQGTKWAQQGRRARTAGAAATAIGLPLYAGGLKRSYDRHHQTVGKSLAEVGKDRRFDPEADRQRRLGTYSGLAAGGAIVTGDRAARTLKAVPATTKRTRSLALKAGEGRKGILLGAATAGLAGLAGASYKRGISERNQPWS